MTDHLDLLAVRVDRVDFAGAMTTVRRAIASRRPHHLVTVNVDFLKQAQADPAYRHLLNTADLCLADGMPLVWAARLQGAPLPERITGMDLLLGCAALSAAEGHRLYLLGAAPGVAQAAAAALRRRCPGVVICGTDAPPFGAWSPEEERAIVARIQAAQPDMLFVAFGAPRQEVFIRAHLAEFGVPVCVGIGGVLNFLAGRVRRAPAWMQDLGLEWLHRLVQEPGRLWRRYLVDDLPVVLALLAQPRPLAPPGRTSSPVPHPAATAIAFAPPAATSMAFAPTSGSSMAFTPPGGSSVAFAPPSGSAVAVALPAGEGWGR